ncbi:hypothetical protein FBULB1_1532 [Fusarium bulbicola]|nr:hypothetical protein FBULB1_1532 [Fusarium bulbicola]
MQPRVWILAPHGVNETNKREPAYPKHSALIPRSLAAWVKRNAVSAQHHGPTRLLARHLLATSIPNLWSLVAQMIRLNLLLYDVIVFLNTQVVDAQDADSVKRGFDYQLLHSLDEWADKLPIRLCYSEENVMYWAHEGFGAIFVTLHINYNHAGQLLFYQHLQSARGQDQLDDGTQGFAQRCKQHATNLCDLIYEAKRRSDTVVLYPLAGHILCLASTVQIHTLLFGFEDDEILAAKTRLERNFEMISSMNNYWPMNHMSISRLQHFHNACLRSKDDSFRLDAWMLRFLLGFTQDIKDRDAIWTSGHRALDDFDPLRDLLDI